MKKLMKHLPSLCWILVGNLMYAFVVALFVLPGQLISCGTTGLALVAQQLWGIPVSAGDRAEQAAVRAGLGGQAHFLVLHLPGQLQRGLALLGLAVLGKKFAMTTVLSSFIYPIFLTGAQALLGDFRVTEDLLLCAAFGGMGLGISLGIVIRAGASTGGMDIPPLILNKLFGIPVPITLWLFDFTIMLSQLFFHTPEDLLYGIVMLIAVNFTLNKTLVAGTGRTEVKIVSEQAREICDSILRNADRGVTLLHGEGGYLHEPTEVVFSVVATRELHRVQNLAREIDPECFMVVTQVTEVSGRGFSFGKEYRKKAEQE